MDTKKDLFDEWLDSIDNLNTRNNYGPYFRRLLEEMGLTAEEMKGRLKTDPGDAWREGKVKSREPAFTPKGREIALCAFRHFIRYCDVFPPNDKIPKAPKAKRTPYMEWEQAVKICDAASPPYRWVFRLQLFCGWGVGEFLQFNASAENWDRAKAAVGDGRDFLRFDFSGRKRNPRPWYTLIPTFVLKEIFESNAKFPLTTSRGKPLDKTNYHSAVVLLESAFKNAVKRAALKLDPLPSPHEFRDTFRTHCTKSGIVPEVKEFAMGHKVDALGYEKCYRDMEFVWNQLRKAFAPTNVPEEAAKKAVMAMIRAQYGDLPPEKLAELERLLPRIETADELAKKAMNLRRAMSDEDDPAIPTEPEKHRTALTNGLRRPRCMGLTSNDLEHIGKQLELLLPVVWKLVKFQDVLKKGGTISEIDEGMFEAVEVRRLRRLMKLLDRLVDEGYAVYGREDGEFKIGHNDSEEAQAWADFRIPP